MQEKFKAWILMAAILRDAGKAAEAKQAARQAITAVREFRRVAERQDLHLTGSQRLLLEKDTEEVSNRARGF